MTLSPVECAKQAALVAGELLVEMLGKAAVFEKESTYNLVTEADRKAEELITGILSRGLPGCSFLCEEAHHDGRLNADRLWIVDPLDGTTNFVHGLPHCGVSIAYAEKGEILAGVVYDPFKKELFWAEKGRGAFCNEHPLHVSKNAALSASLIATGFYYDRGAMMEKTLAALHGLFKKDIRCMRRYGAASLDLAWIACGRFDGYFEYTLAPWDFAAGIVIVAEAGGTVSDNFGKPGSLFSQGLICSNGLIHDEFLKCTVNPGIVHIIASPDA